MAEALDRRRGHSLHRRRELGDLARRKERRERAALQPPGFALRGQEAVAEPGPQHPELQVVLAVVRGVVEKDMTNRRRIVRGGAQAQNRPADRERPLEIRLAPDLDRIAPQRQHQRQRAARPGRARRIGRNERPCRPCRCRHADRLLREPPPQVSASKRRPLPHRRGERAVVEIVEFAADRHAMREARHLDRDARRECR